MLKTDRPAAVLARLAFWPLPKNSGEFERASTAIIEPLLEQCGLIPSPHQGRPVPEGVWCRLFECRTTALVREARKRLEEDPAFLSLLDELRGDSGIEDQIRWEPAVYRTPCTGKKVPAGPGRSVPAGRGQGHWHTYDTADGLASGVVRAILQDRAGYLWLGVAEGGLVRFDSQSFKTFTDQNGLPNNRVFQIRRDQQGRLWFATIGGGFCFYDGSSFTCFREEDGLADNVLKLYESQDGTLWLGVNDNMGNAGTLCRFDGSSFEFFTAADGVQAQPWTMSQDQEGRLWFGGGSGLYCYDGKEPEGELRS